MLPVSVPAAFVLNVALDTRSCAVLHAVQEFAHVLSSIVPRLSALPSHLSHVKSASVRLTVGSEVVNAFTMENVFTKVALVVTGVSIDLLAVALFLVQIKIAFEVATITPGFLAVSLLVEVDPVTLVSVAIWRLDPSLACGLVVYPVTDVIFA